MVFGCLCENLFSFSSPVICICRQDAIDGKTLRASNRRGAERAHLLSVVSHELGITLCQKALSEKEHEIPASRAILKMFDVAQKVVTTDALLTQRRFSEAICAQGGDYLLPVKANQLEVLEAIESQFRKPTDATDFQTAYEVSSATSSYSL